MLISDMDPSAYERVVRAEDEQAHYQGIIAIHSTTLGPAVGGTRLWQYTDASDMTADAKRLAKGMTYKNALAGLPFGGGKAVIARPQVPYSRECLFKAHGHFVDFFKGTFITAEDVGTSPGDMNIVRLSTPHVAGLVNRSGDPSPSTALGVVRAAQAAAHIVWGNDSPRGKVIALQGCGHVGAHVASHLYHMGAQIIACDLEPSNVAHVVRNFKATKVAPESIYDVDCDIFMPCALGGILNENTIRRLRSKIVVGAANNQLADQRDGDELRARKILYVPDYAANAGGMINGCKELLGWSNSIATERVTRIYDTVLEILTIAQRRQVPPHRVADMLAESRFQVHAAQRRNQ